MQDGPKLKLPAFNDVIATHNRNLGALSNWRIGFANHAEDLASYVLGAFPLSSDWTQNSEESKKMFTGCFKNEPAYRGKANTFDPWNGFWGGSFNKNGKSWGQYHVWAKTIEPKPDAKNQFIQPVTQSEKGYVQDKCRTSESLNADDIGYVAQAAQRANGTTAKVDLGINVWSGNEGLTGWVRRLQSKKAEDLPHIAYSPNPWTLIWITQPIPFETGQETIVPANINCPFWMFFEWASGGTYGLHGRKFMLGNPCGDESPTGAKYGSVIDMGTLGYSEYSRQTKAQADANCVC